MLGLLISFLKQFLSPMGFAALLLFITLFLIKKHPKTAIWFVLICLIVVGVLGNPVFSMFLTRSMEWRHMPPAQGAKADAILVLAQGTLPADTPRQRVEVQDQADRLLYAATLYQQQAAPLVIISGSASQTASAHTLLLELGVPKDAILVQAQSSNLPTDAELTAPILALQEVKHILLVTSAIHMDRAYFVFRQLGIEVTPAPTDYRVSLQDWKALTAWDWRSLITKLMPTSEAFNQSTQVLWEYFGLAFYRVKAIF
ncbi:MAG: YdcF family protein [Chloroflexota bacterium]|nr:YdcF family protein [Chloroflexota bacterium]